LDKSCGDPSFSGLDANVRYLTVAPESRHSASGHSLPSGWKPFSVAGLDLPMRKTTAMMELQSGFLMGFPFPLPNAL
jgi:hypothetical protein